MPAKSKKTSEKPRMGRPPTHVGKFGQWIEDQGLTRAEVAEKLGVKRRHVDNLCREDFIPSLKLAVDIEELTGGEVKPAYWIRDLRVKT